MTQLNPDHTNPNSLSVITTDGATVFWWDRHDPRNLPSITVRHSGRAYSYIPRSRRFDEPSSFLRLNGERLTYISKDRHPRLYPQLFQLAWRALATAHRVRKITPGDVLTVDLLGDNQ